MNNELNNTFKKQRHKYMKRITITNGLTDKIITYFNNFASCNIIDTNIKKIINIDTIDEKEKQMVKLFPTVNFITEPECNEILNSIWKSKYLSNAPVQEYNWFRKIIKMIENIPICITISTARKEHFGFPLVYVNKHFEKTTEYHRDEVLGKNCKFLQTKEPIEEEMSQHILLCKSLREALSTSIIITNVKKSGTLFYNLLSFKPIFDIDGNYIYCMGVQTEITEDAISTIAAQNIIDVLNILCNI